LILFTWAPLPFLAVFSDSRRLPPGEPAFQFLTIIGTSPPNGTQNDASKNSVKINLLDLAQSGLFRFASKLIQEECLETLSVIAKADIAVSKRLRTLDEVAPFQHNLFVY